MVFSLVSLLAVAAIAAIYFTSAQPLAPAGSGVEDNGGFQKLKEKATAAGAMMQNHAQEQVDAATASPAPATNAPPAGN